LRIDSGLNDSQRTMAHFVRRTLDDLYWVMSYSRWKDAQYWPLFRDEMLRTHSILSESSMESAQKYNFERYHYQGIGRYEPEDVYARGIADLRAIASLMPEQGFLFGSEPSSIDAGIYGFIANIHFFRIETPLKRFVDAEPKLVRHCHAIHAAVSGKDKPK
jgi:glutathione S-transferase